MVLKDAAGKPRPLRSVLVTGAAGALGSIILKRFSQEGIEVISVDRSAPHSNELSPHPELAGVVRISADLARSDSVKVVFETIRASGRSVEGLIHCAGGFRYAPIESTTDEDIEFLVSANLKSTIFVLREALPLMKAQGFGRIVLISSLATQKPFGGVSVYAATKAGVNLLVGSLQEEIKDHDININAILPSIIDTPANRKGMGEQGADQWVDGAELADIALNLMRPLGRSIRGALIPVAGRV